MGLKDSIGSWQGGRLEEKLFATVRDHLEPGEALRVGVVAQSPGEIGRNVKAITQVGGANLLAAGVPLGLLLRSPKKAPNDDPVAGTPLRSGLVLTDRAVLGVGLKANATPKRFASRTPLEQIDGAAFLEATYRAAGATIRHGALALTNGTVYVFELGLSSTERFSEFCSGLEESIAG